MGAIDIVCNLFTSREVSEGRTGLDETFKTQVRMPPEIRDGVSVSELISGEMIFLAILANSQSLGFGLKSRRTLITRTIETMPTSNRGQMAATKKDFNKYQDH